MTWTGVNRPGASPSGGVPREGLAGPDLLDLVPLAVVALDAERRVVRVNRAFTLLLALDQDLRGLRLDELGWQTTVDLDALVARLVEDGGTEPDAEHLVPVVCGGRSLVLRLRLNVAASGMAPDVASVVVLSDVTATQRLRAEAAEQAELFEAFADHVGDGVLIHRGAPIRWASPSVESLLGWAPGELLGRRARDFVHPEDIHDLVRPVEGEALRRRVRLRNAAGEYHWFLTTVTARWENGRAVETYATLRDIDDQVTVERAAERADVRLRLAFDASPDGFAICEAVRDGDGEVVDFAVGHLNAAGRAMLAVRPDDPVGHRVLESWPAIAETGVLRQLADALAYGGLLRSRRVLEISGMERTFDGLVAKLDEDSVLVLWRDVTEQVEGEERLARAYEETAEMRATLQTALDATSDGFAVYALETDEYGELLAMRVVHANAAGANSLHLDPHDMIGMEIHEFFPEVESSGLWERIAEATLTKAPQYHRVHVFAADGQWESSWDNTVAPVGEERMAITWRNVSAEERALRQLAAHRDEAMYSATHDALTDLPNRVLLREHLQEALRTCRVDQRVGIVFVDLDRFKAINDTFGHAAGDAVLKATAARLQRVTRQGDLAARLAGDEFVMVLTQLAVDWEPADFFARATALLAEDVTHEGVVLHPAASLGVVMADPRAKAVDADSLIKAADAAMYESKAARRAAR